MRLPINLVLYVASAGLLGLAGHTVYQAVQESSRDVRKKVIDAEHNRAIDLLGGVKNLSAVSSTWSYDTQKWEAAFRAPNLTGKEPPKADATPVTKVEETKVVDQRPLETIFEIVTLVCDTGTNGEGGKSHAIIRYRPEANVQPPAWYTLENTPAAGVSTPAASPGDAVVGRGRPTRPPVAGGNRPPAQVPAATPMPMSTAGADILQKLWVGGDGTPKFEASLWPPFQDVKIVRIWPDCKSATFRRNSPPKPDSQPGQPVPQVEEQVFKSVMASSPDLGIVLRELHANDKAHRLVPTTSVPAAPTGRWNEFDETTIVGNTVHVSKKDTSAFETDSNQFLDKISVDTFVSRQASNMRGLMVMNVSPELSSRYGVQRNDLLLSVNDIPVSTKADAIAVGKRLYNQGERTFRAKFITADGQEVVRVVQLPDR